MATHLSQTHGFGQLPAASHHGNAVLDHNGAQNQRIADEGIFHLKLDGEDNPAAAQWTASYKHEPHCDRGLYGRDCETTATNDSSVAEPISTSTQSAMLAIALDETAQGERIVDLASLSKELERIYNALMQEGFELGIMDPFYLTLHIINNGPQPKTTAGRALTEKIIRDGTLHKKPCL